MRLSAFTRSLAGLASLSAALALVGAEPAWAQVKTETLGTLDLWSPPGRDTGLGADLWRGAAPPVVVQSLDGLGERAASPAAAALARRLLSTGANAPDGAGSDLTLAGARVRALVALGDPSAAATILSRTSRVEAGAALSRARSEAGLALGRDTEACDAAAALQEDRDSPWQLELRAYCSLVSGQPAAAQVTLDLWRQAGGKDPAFERLMAAALNGPGASPVRASLTTPLASALSRRLNLDLGPAVADAHPSVIAALARDSAAPAAARLEAVARALRLGLIAPQEARAVYLAAPPADGPPPSLEALTPDPTAGAEAALLAIASRSADPVVRQKALVLLLGRAHGAGEFIALARLARPALAETVQLGAPLDDPMEFALAAAVSGDAATFGALRGKLGQDGAPGAGAADLAILDAAAAVAAGGPAGPAFDRLAELGGAADPRTRARVQGAALLLAGTGQPISDGGRAALLGFTVPAAKSAPARLAVLALDAGRGLKGETGLVAAAMAQALGPAMGAADRAALVQALSEAGLADEARAIALEGLVSLARP